NATSISADGKGPASFFAIALFAPSAPTINLARNSPSPPRGEGLRVGLAAPPTSPPAALRIAERGDRFCQSLVTSELVAGGSSGPRVISQPSPVPFVCRQ